VDIPRAVPLMALRVDDRMIVSVPGEMTAEMARRVRHAVERRARGDGVRRAVISGLANEYSSYYTTPEEYDAQHYEGAATVYGRASSVAVQEVLVKLTAALVNGATAPEPYPYDPRNGVQANAAPFSRGAAEGAMVEEPQRVARRLRHPAIGWRGAPRGFDRPLESAFVKVQRRSGGDWRTVESDLGLEVLWQVDADGLYRAHWEPPYDQRLGTYRFRITANRYGLTSRRFHLKASRALKPSRRGAPPGSVAVELRYPRPRVREDVGDPAPDATASLTARPGHVPEGAGRVTFVVDGERRTVSAGADGRFQVGAGRGARVTIPAGAARDRFGNFNARELSFRVPRS
jgi:hypothetical protein